MAFPVDTLISLDLYTPKVSYIYWSDKSRKKSLVSRVLWTDFPHGGKFT